eukprot:345375_1
MEAHVDNSPNHEVIPIVSDDDPIRSDSDVGNTRTTDVNTTDDFSHDIQAEMAAVLEGALSVNPKQSDNAPKTITVSVQTTSLAKGRGRRTDDTPDTEDDEAQPSIPSLHKQKTIRTHFSDVFEWIDPVIHYYPGLWIRRDPNKKSAVISNWWILAVAISTAVLYGGMNIYLQWVGWDLYPAIDNIVWILSFTFITVARMISIIYSVKHFNWPWSRESLPFYYQQQTEIGNKDRVVKYRRLYIILSIVYIVSDLITVIMEEEELMDWYHGSVAFYYVQELLTRVFLFYPLLMILNIQCVVFVKFNLCLDQLLQEMKDPSTVDLQTTCEEYEKLYKRFRRDYHSTLRSSVACYLVSEVMFFWDSFNYMGMHVVMIFLVLRTFGIFALFFHAASNLEKVHKRLADEIWKNGQFFLGKKNFYYTYILQYIEKYSIYLTVGRVVVTTKNVLKFCFVLMLTRSLSYFGTAWAENKVEEYTATTPAPLFNTTFFE